MHWYNGFGGGWMMIFWWILIIAVVVVLVKWAATSTGGWPGNGNNRLNKSVLDILEERYARGEIDKEEYEEKKMDLMR
jgi:putative membrane protein